jgi:nitrous oxide reductase accessory protein NosL
MKNSLLSLLAVVCLLSSCSSDDDSPAPRPDVVAPATYSFLRDGSTSVSYSGQTTRIVMGEEFISALKDPSKTEAQLDGMFTNTGNNFEDDVLNA